MCLSPFRPGGALSSPLTKKQMQDRIGGKKSVAQLKTIGMDFDCGRCPYCRKKRSSDWAMRIMHEMSTRDNKGCFITLTYRDEDLPPLRSLCKDDVQLYVKRLRKALDKSGAISYYLSGEYGTTTRRPHYHIALLGLSGDDFLKLSCAVQISQPGEKYTRYHDNKWTMGHINVEPLTISSAQYVAWYTTHKRESNYQHNYTGLVKPFQVQSQGIGLAWAETNADVCRANKIRYNGYARGVPRYYCKRLGIDRRKLYDDYIQEQQSDIIASARNAGVQIAPPPPLNYGSNLAQAYVTNTPEPTYTPNNDKSVYWMGLYVSMAMYNYIARLRYQHNISLIQTRHKRDRL